MKPIKTLVLLAAMMGGLVSGEALAACSSGSGSNQVGDLVTLLTGRTVCVPNSSGWEWQEFHQTGSGGDLIDWKLGTSAVDPTETLGTWSVGGTGSNHRVTHTYLPAGGSFPFTVFKNGSGSSATYSFCGGTPPEIVATIKQGQGSCSTLPLIP